jgi:hypothetical protein
MKRVCGLLVVAAAALGLAACTGEHDDGVPNAGGGSSTSAAPPADSGTQEREFVACMRREGIVDMPDPIPGDTSGRSAVKYALDVLGKGSDMTFQAALEKCKPLLPTVVQQPPSAEDTDVDRRFAKCMRDNGIPEFPDPDPTTEGHTRILFMAAPEGGSTGSYTGPRVAVTDSGIVLVNLGDPEVSAAVDKCKSIFPPNA